MVYSVIICVHRTIYNGLKDDPTLEKLDIIKNAVPNKKQQVFHLCGKIGETENFPKRVKSYKYSEKGMLSGILMIIEMKK